MFATAEVSAVETPSGMWAIEDYLRQRRREIDETFDYRYSQLPVVFARLIQAGHLDESVRLAPYRFAVEISGRPGIGAENDAAASRGELAGRRRRHP